MATWIQTWFTLYCYYILYFHQQMSYQMRVCLDVERKMFRDNNNSEWSCCNNEACVMQLTDCNSKDCFTALYQDNLVELVAENNILTLIVSAIFFRGFLHDSPGFLCQSWIQGQPWKVLEFHKTENVLELFWKTSGRSWIVWNLPMWNFQQDLVTVRTSCHIAIKRVEELP